MTVTPAAGDPAQHPFLFLWALCMMHALTQTQIKVKMNLKKYRKEMIEDSDKWDQVEGFIPQWSEVCKNSMKKLSKILRKGASAVGMEWFHYFRVRHLGEMTWPCVAPHLNLKFTGCLTASGLDYEHLKSV